MIIDNVKDFNEWIGNNDCSTIAFDTETTSLSYYDLEIESFQIYNGKEAIFVPLYNKDDEWTNPEHNELLARLYYLLKVKVKTMVGQNLVYDLSVLYKYNIKDIEHLELFDTQVAHHLIDENSETGLKKLAVYYLGEEEPMKYEEARAFGFKSKEFYTYAVNDVIWCWKIAKMQKEELEEQEVVSLFRDIEMPYQWCLLEMKVNGMLVDLDRVEKVRDEIEQAIEEMNLEMHNMLDTPYSVRFTKGGKMIIEEGYNFNSSKQLASILIDKLGLTLTEKTPTGSPKTGAEVLDKFKDNEFVSKLISYKVARKLLTAFFKPLPDLTDSDGRVRPSFNDCGTVTGRLSCSSPNLQQLPKKRDEFPVETRACFIAPKGYKMVTCDYSGQEVAVMAEVSQDPTLVASLNNGYDMHLAIANQFYELGIPTECLNKTHEDYDKYLKEFKTERSRAKTITFGLAYGKGAYGFSKDFNIPEEEAQDIVDKYFEGMPKLKEAIDESHKEVDANGYVVSLSGRRRRFEIGSWGGYSNSAKRQAFNFKIQGYSADMIRMASIAVRKIEKLNPQWGLTQVATVHDENVYIVKEKYAEKVANVISSTFSSVVNFCVPVVADTSIGDNYEEAK